MNSGKKQNRRSAACKAACAYLLTGILIVMSLTACGNRLEASDGDVLYNAYEVQETQDDDTEIKKAETVNAEEAPVKPQESSTQAVESTDLERTAEELLELFINGSISAVDSTDSTKVFYITDLNRDSEEWETYCVGDKADLDNDGEEELILCGPYGGKYLDARDNKVYEFAAGGGTALALSYTCYNGAVWILYSNKMNVGYECYHMEKYEGADNLAAEINFSEELVDQNNAESGMKYTWNETEISYGEYTALCSKIFAAQVETNFWNRTAYDSQTKYDDVLENLAGEYEYLSDYGTGRLMIKKTAYGYDISDYESESSYRFLADSSNIETIENNRIYIKYPEQVFSDGTANFSRYILEYGTDGITVYHAKSENEEGQFLYRATIKS